MNLLCEPLFPVDFGWAISLGGWQISVLGSALSVSGVTLGIDIHSRGLVKPRLHWFQLGSTH